MCKYLTSFSAIIISFVAINKTEFFYLWVVFAFISTMYSYYWDIKYDFGLLEPNVIFITQQPNRFLRKILIYEKKSYYYSVIIVNLILRFFWVLNISNATGGLIPIGFMKQNLFTNFLLCIIEMFRRIIWNLFRVEYEHTKNCGKLNAVPPLDYGVIIQNIPNQKYNFNNFESSTLVDHENFK